MATISIAFLHRCALDSLVLVVMVLLLLSRAQLFCDLSQAPLSMGLSRQRYWSGLPFPFPVDLPNPGLKPMSPALAGRLFTTEPPGKPIDSWWWWWVSC